MRFGSPKLARALLVAAGMVVVATAVLVTGCGRMPPVGFWEPSAADTTGIRQAVMDNQGLLVVDFDEPMMQVADLVIPESVITKAIEDNPFKPRFRCDSFWHLFDTTYELEMSFIATLDTLYDSILDSVMNVKVETTWIETTATVALAETIPGTLELHAYRYTRFLKDSVFETSPGETVRLKFYDTLFTDTSMMVRKPISAAVQGGCVLRKEAGAWKLWKISGGNRFCAPTPEDAPYLVSLQLASSNRTDTIALRPDTLHYGIQRFYAVGDEAGNGSELLKFTVGDSARIPVISGYSTDINNFMHYKGERRRVTPTTRAVFAETGIRRLYVQQIPFTVFFDVDGELVSLVWGIPIQVVGGDK